MQQRFISTVAIFLLSAHVWAAEHGKHDGHDHGNETAEEHAKHADHEHDHSNETAEEHAKHADHEHDHAEHEHGKPHHGGIVHEVDGVHHELVVSEEQVMLYAEDLPTGEALQTIQVRLTILQGTNKQDVDMQLDPEDQHRFVVENAFQLVAGDKLVALIRAEGQKPRLARFEMPAESKND